MKLYLYTENLSGRGFVMGEKADENDPLIMLDNVGVTEAIAALSERECEIDVSEVNPIGINLVSRVFSAYFSFIILTDQKTSKGRNKVIFGCSDSVWYTNKLKKIVKWIPDALKEFSDCLECKLTISSMRIEDLCEILNRTIDLRCRK